MESLTEKAGIEWLMKAASNVPCDKAIVELGVYRGGSLSKICDAAKTSYIYGVDSWGTRPGIYKDRPHMLRAYTIQDKKLAKIAIRSRAKLIHATTVEAASKYDGPEVDLLYIDAEHRKEAVLNDFHAWLPYLSESAWVAFDDYEPSKIGIQVIEAVNELVDGRKLFGLNVIGKRLAVGRING